MQFQWLKIVSDNVYYKEPVLLETLFELANASAQAQAAEALPALFLPEQLALLSPSGAEQEPMAAPTDASVTA